MDVSNAQISALRLGNEQNLYSSNEVNNYNFASYTWNSTDQYLKNGDTYSVDLSWHSVNPIPTPVQNAQSGPSQDSPTGDEPFQRFPETKLLASRHNIVTTTGDNPNEHGNYKHDYVDHNHPDIIAVTGIYVLHDCVMQEYFTDWAIVVDGKIHDTTKSIIARSTPVNWYINASFPNSTTQMALVGGTNSHAPVDTGMVGNDYKPTYTPQNGSKSIIYPN